MVSAVRKFRILDSNRDCIARISEIASDLDALQRLILFAEHKSYRIIRLKVTLNDQADSTGGTVWLHRNVALLKGLLERLRVGLSVLFSKCGDLLAVCDEFFCLLFNNSLFDLRG